jgi:hypothetical protein
LFEWGSSTLYPGPFVPFSRTITICARLIVRNVSTHAH